MAEVSRVNRQGAPPRPSTQPDDAATIGTGRWRGARLADRGRQRRTQIRDPRSEAPSPRLGEPRLPGAAEPGDAIGIRRATLRQASAAGGSLAGGGASGTV